MIDRQNLDVCLVPIQPSGTKSPLFMASPGGGVAHPYYRLGALLDKDQPLFALQPPALVEGDSQFPRVEDMAARYVEAIRSLQPEGPYFIAGWSFGGMVAYEMAQQLRRDGERIGLLLLVDTYARPIEAKDRLGFATRLLSLFRNLPIGLAMVRHTVPYIRDGLYLMALDAKKKKRRGDEHPSPTEYVRWAWADLMRHYFLKRANIANVVSQDSRLLLIRRPTIRRAFRALNANLMGLRRYRPCTYPGRLVMLRARQQLLVRSFYKDPDLGWGHFAEGGVEVRAMGGNHAALLLDPYVQELADHLNDCLRNAYDSVSEVPEQGRVAFGP